jgi:hypothetical protein
MGSSVTAPVSKTSRLRADTRACMKDSWIQARIASCPPTLPAHSVLRHGRNQNLPHRRCVGARSRKRRTWESGALRTRGRMPRRRPSCVLWQCRHCLRWVRAQMRSSMHRRSRTPFPSQRRRRTGPLRPERYRSIANCACCWCRLSGGWVSGEWVGWMSVDLGGWVWVVSRCGF